MNGWSIVLTRLVRYNRIIPTIHQYLVWTPELTRSEEGINLLKMAERTARMTLDLRERQQDISHAPNKIDL